MEVGGPGHYTVISCDLGYSLFPMPLSPVPVTRQYPRNQPIWHSLYLLQYYLHPTRHAWLPSFNRQTSKDVCQEKARYIYWVMEFKRRKSEHERKGLKIKEVQFLFVGLGSNSLKGSLFFLLYFSNPFHKISS